MRRNYVVVPLILSALALAGVASRRTSLARHPVELRLKLVQCHVTGLESYCEEIGGGKMFEVADIPEALRDNLITQCSIRSYCDMTLTVPYREARKTQIHTIMDASWDET
ncbi:hypothetical protein GCM10007207_17560 [Asaia siamensis]|uniref:Uncharacterized protein n=1 Tax=Asaia siamensis TaxID=110479 RepID=A0ABQ1M4G1_9PROT|nr:hypothetical protein AA0323_2693 [Asaia siamensis NRIC 0323]GGC32566.1 hypothetical protein GCM10007207_17560 [Asaia siamensis]